MQGPIEGCNSEGPKPVPCEIVVYSPHKRADDSDAEKLPMGQPFGGKLRTDGA